MAGRGSKPGERRGGRQKGTRNKITADIKIIAKEYGENAIMTLVDIMQRGDTPAPARVAAAKEILDRGYGKSAQVIDQSIARSVLLDDPNPDV